MYGEGFKAKALRGLAENNGSCGKAARRLGVVGIGALRRWRGESAGPVRKEVCASDGGSEAVHCGTCRQREDQCCADFQWVVRILGGACGFSVGCADFGSVVRILSGLCGLCTVRNRLKTVFLGLKIAVAAPIRRKIAMTGPHRSSEIRTARWESAQLVGNPHGSLSCAANRERPLYALRKRFGIGSSPLPQPRETGLISRLGLAHMRTSPTSKSQIVGKWPFLNRTRNVRRDRVYPLLAPIARNGRISRLCAAHASIRLALKS